MVSSLPLESSFAMEIRSQCKKHIGAYDVLISRARDVTIYFVSNLFHEEGRPGCCEVWETQVRLRKVWLAFPHRWLGTFPEARPTGQTRRDLAGSDEVSCVLYDNDRVRREIIAQLAMHLSDGLEEILPPLTMCVLRVTSMLNDPFFHNDFLGSKSWSG